MAATQRPELEFLDESALAELGGTLDHERKHRCTECNTANRHSGEYTREGWCPVTQRFTVRSKPATRFRTYFEQADTEQIGEQFHAAVKCLDAGRCAELLKSRPELLLMTFELGRCSWSAWHEVANLFSPEDTNDSPAAKVLEVFLKVRVERTPALDLNHKQLRKSDSRSSPLHQAAYRGSRVAMTLLCTAGADMFSVTGSGWMPIHTACLHHAPAKTVLDTFLPWLEAEMQRLLGPGKHLSLATPPRGFKESVCTVPDRPPWAVLALPE